MSVFRIIGDVHGHQDLYADLIKDADYSIQLGDMGFDYSIVETLDETRHRFVPGNHDNYDALPPQAFQKDWGQVSMGPFDFFYIRGAYSVDKMWRTPGVSWWEQEEMGWSSARQLVETVTAMEPKIIFSHDCPEICMDHGVITNNAKFQLSLTTQIMSAVWEAWQPDLWMFGHHHNDWMQQIDNTHFICLNSLSCADLVRSDDVLKVLIKKFSYDEE